jgi:hypothetical protein
MKLDETFDPHMWRRLRELGEYHGSLGVIDEYHRIASPSCELCEEVRGLRRAVGLGEADR